MNIVIKFGNMKLVVFVICIINCVNILAQLSKIQLNSKSTVWKIKPQSEVGKDSFQLFQPGYNVENWLKAVVPGAVFTSYVEAGKEKDPN